MPGTTRYSATFDRPYEEEPLPELTNGARRPRSQSLQAYTGLEPYTPLGNNRHSPRSSSTESTKGAEHIPTRTVSKTVVKTHNNPFQFVKVGTCPLYRKAEEQLKKVKEVKKPEVLIEEEEWQSNLDSWKSRRRKMSEDVIKRQEEIKQFEMEEQSLQTGQKKVKTFSEMVESRAHRGRTLSLCLLSSPLDLQQYELENKNNSSQFFSGDSEENSAVNSEDEGACEKQGFQKTPNSWPKNLHRNGVHKNGTKMPSGDGSYADSGLESISSSHRTIGTPDSCSDFSPDSGGSSIDCDSPRSSGLNLNGINLLDDFNVKKLMKSDSNDSFLNMKTTCDKADTATSLLNENSNHDRNEENGHTSNMCSEKVDFESSISKSKEHIEQSVESENEVFVDDFEELNSKKSISSNRLESEKKDSFQNEKSTSNKARCLDDSLNIVYQSQLSNNANSPQAISANGMSSSATALNDILPVEKIAEEMEKLILQQLEDEEKAKEMSSKLQTSDIVGSPEHIITPPRLSEPPKEKPPPPPSTEEETPPKPTSLKRINSTKRIKSEIYKRRSNFLGIENGTECTVYDDSIPPPPALEEILKAEMELDRESMRKLDDAATERFKREEMEMLRKEQEIIATLETEERQKSAMQIEEMDILQEEDRIRKLKEERKRKDQEEQLAEIQRLKLAEERELKEREEYVRKQEGNAPFSEPAAPLSEAATLSNTASLSTETTHNVSLSGGGGGQSADQPLNEESCEVLKKPDKPAVPPKPLKKKEAIRKERERLRQEQEALQREREEHRQKLLKEQEELSKKAHAPAVSRLGPVPPAKPSVKPKLTKSASNQPSARENIIYTSHSPCYSAQNGSTSEGKYEPVSAVVSKPMKSISHKKPVPNQAFAQQKISPVKKQPQDSASESKYNQNHWLIQEAEMRRIAELKERQQHSTQYPIPQTHLADDAVYGTSPRAPIHPTNGTPGDKVHGYGSSNMPLKKYPPVVSSEMPHAVYQRAAQPPSKPNRIVPMETTEQMLSVSGRKRCSHCNEELGQGAAMIIESLQLYYHIHCFQCCVCQAQLGNGSCGADVRVRNRKLHCHNCYSNDEKGLKFSQV